VQRARKSSSISRPPSVIDQPPLPVLRARLAWGNKLCCPSTRGSGTCSSHSRTLASFPSRDPFIGTRVRLSHCSRGLLHLPLPSIPCRRRSAINLLFPAHLTLTTDPSYNAQPTTVATHLRDQPYDRPLRLRQPHGLPWHSQYPSAIESVPPGSVPKGFSVCYEAQAAHSQPPTLFAPGSGTSASVKSFDQFELLSPCQTSSTLLKWPAGSCPHLTASVCAVSFRPRRSPFKSVVIRVPHVAHDRLPPVSKLLYLQAEARYVGRYQR
jgi:hypothetical protein